MSAWREYRKRVFSRNVARDAGGRFAAKAGNAWLPLIVVAVLFILVTLAFLFSQ